MFHINMIHVAKLLLVLYLNKKCLEKWHYSAVPVLMSKNTHSMLVFRCSFFRLRHKTQSVLGKKATLMTFFFPCSLLNIHYQDEVADWSCFSLHISWFVDFMTLFYRGNNPNINFTHSRATGDQQQHSVHPLGSLWNRVCCSRTRRQTRRESNREPNWERSHAAPP